MNNQELLALRKLSSDIDNGLKDLQSVENSYLSLENAINQGEDAFFALDALLSNLELSKETFNYNICQDDLVNQFTSYIAKNIGYQDKEILEPELSHEGFSTTIALSISQETKQNRIVGFTLAVLEAIIQGITNAIDYIKRMYDLIFVNYDKMKKYANELKTKLYLLHGFKAGKAKSVDFSKALSINGTPSDPVKAAQVFYSVIRQIGSNWGAEKLGTGVKEYVENAIRSNGSFSGIGSVSFIDKFIQGGELKKLFPFTNSSISKDDVFKLFGKVLQEGEEAYVSSALPANRQVLIILPTYDRQSGDVKGNLYARLLPMRINEYDKLDFEIDILNKNQASEIIGSIILALNAGNDIKSRLRRVHAIGNDIKRMLLKLKASNTVYNTASKVSSKIERKTRADFTFNQATMRSLRMVIKVLHEPGASTCSYVLFQSKAFLDYVSWSIRKVGTTNKQPIY